MISQRGGKRSSPPPEALAAYKDLAVIGKGSFGRILKVERIADGQIFARKELDYSIMSERDKSQILAEIKILSWLNHINIVKYVERIPDSNAQLLHIIMEYCEGGDLGSLIKKNRRERTTIPEHVVWSKLAQMVSALDACHHGMPCNPKTGTGNTPPILHRDLKPENVFLDGEQNVKLGDFGLSKELDAAHALASTYVGTPYYMSPELATGARYDAKSDIWALGCITYELCALRPPFDATSQAELTIKIKSGHVPSLPRSYSRDLENLVRRMLDLDPRKRPSTKKLLEERKISLDLQSIELSGMRQGLLQREQACEANTLKLHAWEQNLEERERALEQREQQIEAHIQVQVEQRLAAFIASSPYAADAAVASSSRLDAPQPVSRASPIRPVTRPSIGPRRVSNISDVSMGEASRRSIKPPMASSSARRISVGPARRVKQEEEINDEWYDTAGGESSSDGGADEGRRGSRSAPFASAATSLRASRSTARRSAPQQAQPASTASSSAESSSTRPAPAAPAHSAPAVPLSSSYSSSPSRRATEQQQSRGLTTRKSMPSIPQSITGASSARRTSITPRRVAPPPPMQAGVARLAHLMNQEKAALGGGGAANTSMSAFTERSDVSMRDATFGPAAAIAGGDKENDVGGTSALSAILQHRKVVEEKKKTAGRTSIVAHARRLTLEQQRRQEVEQQQQQDAEVDGQNGAEEDDGPSESSKIGSRAAARKVEPAMEQRGCDSWDEEYHAVTTTPQTQHEDATSAGEVAVYDLSNDPDLPSPFLRKDERPSRGTAVAGAGMLRTQRSRVSLAARSAAASSSKPAGRSLEQELVRKRQATTTTTATANGSTSNIGLAAKARGSTTSEAATSASTARLSSVAARRPSHNGGVGDGPPSTMSRLAAGSAAAASRTSSSTLATGSARRQPMGAAVGVSSTARIPAVRKSLAPAPAT